MRRHRRSERRAFVPTPGVRYRVLSIHPPWAWAIIFGGKDVENRSWVTKHRGLILIHASSRRYGGRLLAEAREIIATNSSLSLTQIPTSFPSSSIIGAVELVDCVDDHSSAWAYPGEQHWLLRNPVGLKVPIEGVSGKLNLWWWQAGSRRE